MQNDRFVKVDVSVYKEIEKIKAAQFEGCECPKCVDLLDILTQLVKGGRSNTLQTGSIIFNTRAYDLLEFGEFHTCSEGEGCAILSRFKAFYGKYLDQWAEFQKKFADAQGHQLVYQLMELQNKRLSQCLNQETARVEILRKHLLLSNASYSGNDALKDEEAKLDRMSVSESSSLRSKLGKDLMETIADKAQAELNLKHELYNLKTRMSNQANLYFKDVVVSGLKSKNDELEKNVQDLLKTISEKEAVIEEMRYAQPCDDEAGTPLRPVVINIDPCSFRTRKAAEEFLSRPDVLNLAEEYPNAVFYDGPGLAMREHRKRVENISPATYENQEIRRLRENLECAKSEIATCNEKLANYDEMEKKLAMMKEKYEGHQENPLALKAVMSGYSPLEAKLR